MPYSISPFAISPVVQLIVAEEVVSDEIDTSEIVGGLASITVLDEAVVKEWLQELDVLPDKSMA